MPFTISHVAAVLPFARHLNRWRMLSAAVIGSMVPDFGFLLPWRVTRIETHSISGLLSFCLPVGLMTYWLFEYIVKPASLEVFSGGAYERLRPFARPEHITSAKQWLVAAIAILLGAVTHLILDGFTHEGAHGVRMIPMLDDVVPGMGGHMVRAFGLLQIVSSLLGLFVILVVLWRTMRPGAQARPRLMAVAERRVWLLAYATAAILIGLWCLSPGGVRLILNGARTNAVNEAAVAALRGIAGSLLGVSLMLRLRLGALRGGRDAPAP